MRKRPTKSSSFHTKERQDHHAYLDFQTDCPLVMSSRLPSKTPSQNPISQKRQHSRNKSELFQEKQPIDYTGFKRVSSRKKHTASKQIKKSEEKLKTFGATIEYNQSMPTKNYQVMDSRPMDTFGYEKTATSRQRPQLPTNILSNLGSLKNKINMPSIPIVPLMEEYERMSKEFGKSVMLKEPRAKSTTKQRKAWDGQLVPMKPQAVLQNYAYLLTDDQKAQILQYSKIYYIGHKAIKRHQGFDVDYDNQEKEYLYNISDHISYRYQILKFLGKGSYGQVFKVYDHKRKQQCALKMIKNKKKFAKQSLIEINILTHIKEHDPHGVSGIVKIRDFFFFRKHQCIIFELLHQNLYELIKGNNYVGLDINIIQKIAIQVLNSLKFLRQQKLIHCDLKPENILLVESQKTKVKVIDFGSSCFQNQILYSYIQSRYYRAPEVTLGIPYSPMIDMWSMGCIMAELYLGTPLFPGDTEQQQMCYMLSCLGNPDPQLLKHAERRKVFFNDDFSVRDDLDDVDLTPSFGRPLKELILQKDKLFLSFLQTVLRWDPKSRPTPKQALQHPWILEGIPQQIKYLQSFFQQDLEYDGTIKNNFKIERRRSKQKATPMNKRQPKSASKSRQKSVKDRMCHIYNVHGVKRENKSVPTKNKIAEAHSISIKCGSMQPKRKFQLRKQDFKQFFTEK